MQLAGAQALYAALHKDAPFHDGSFANWSADRSRDFPFHFSDGVTIWMSPTELAPDDKFLG